MNLEEAILLALDYETNVRDVYRDALGQVDDKVGTRVLNLLAQEEQGHLDYLEARLREWQNTGKVQIEKLDSLVPPKNDVEAEINKLKQKFETEKSEVKFKDIEFQILKKALALEIETSEFYKRMVLELPEEGQELFIRFVEIEEGHKAMVQAELDSVTGLGYWFDMPEFDLAGAK